MDHIVSIRIPAIRLAVVMAFCLVGTSCEIATATVCTDELRSVIRVDVFDSVTGAPAAAGATVLLEGTLFRDSVAVPDTATSATAHYWLEDKVKAGSYNVQVRKPGYRLWARNDVRLASDGCHVSTFEFLSARLQR
jgi:hypothetical protein